MKTTVQAPLSDFYDQLWTIGRKLEYEFMFVKPYEGRPSDPMLRLQVFSRAVELYERVNEDGELPSLSHGALYEAFNLEAQRKMAANPLVVLPFIRTVVKMLAGYYDLPAAERQRCLERSDELFAMRPLATVADHYAVWNSELPVCYLNSEKGRSQDYFVSPYERWSYILGHNSADSKIYGSNVLMLLSAYDLKRALDLFVVLDPGGSPKALSLMAGFKRAVMTPSILIEALELGYSSKDQLKRAGELIGITSRDASYFPLIFAGGVALATQARFSLEDGLSAV